MIKRDFTAWDFVKQKPKEICGYSNVVGGYSSTITIGNGYSNNIVGGGTNNIIHGNGVAAAHGISDTTFVQNLSVAGSMNIPSYEGQMRTIMDEDGYWATQVFITEIENPEGRWSTISITDSMMTVGGISTRPKKHITWVGHFFSKLKLWLKKDTTRPYRGHYEI